MEQLRQQNAQKKLKQNFKCSERSFRIRKEKRKR